MEIDERKEDVVEVFTEYLVNNGLKKSQERYVVLEAAGKMNGLFTAAELHTYLVNNMNFHLSPATVYSSIKLPCVPSAQKGERKRETGRKGSAEKSFG